MRRALSGGRRPRAAALLLLLLAGCGGGLQPVRGIVTLDDGVPLTKGMVVFERTDGGPPVTARGEVLADGRYVLGTEKPGDGVPTGHYRVLINPLDLSDVPDEQKVLVFDAKYLKFETSELSYEVKPGSNEFAIKLARPKKGRR